MLYDGVSELASKITNFSSQSRMYMYHVRMLFTKDRKMGNKNLSITSI